MNNKVIGIIIIIFFVFLLFMYFYFITIKTTEGLVGDTGLVIDTTTTTQICSDISEDDAIKNYVNSYIYTSYNTQLSSSVISYVGDLNNLILTIKTNLKNGALKNNYIDSNLDYLIFNAILPEIKNASTLTANSTVVRDLSYCNSCLIEKIQNKSGSSDASFNLNFIFLPKIKTAFDDAKITLLETTYKYKNNISNFNFNEILYTNTTLNVNVNGSPQGGQLRDFASYYSGVFTNVKDNFYRNLLAFTDTLVMQKIDNFYENKVEFLNPFKDVSIPKISNNINPDLLKAKQIEFPFIPKHSQYYMGNTINLDASFNNASKNVGSSKQNFLKNINDFKNSCNDLLQSLQSQQSLINQKLLIIKNILDAIPLVKDNLTSINGETYINTLSASLGSWFLTNLNNNLANSLSISGSGSGNINAIVGSGYASLYSSIYTVNNKIDITQLEALSTIIAISMVNKDNIPIKSIMVKANQDYSNLTISIALTQELNSKVTKLNSDFLIGGSQSFQNTKDEIKNIFAAILNSLNKEQTLHSTEDYDVAMLLQNNISLTAKLQNDFQNI